MARGEHSINSRLFLLFVFCMTGILLLISFLFYNRTIVQYHHKLADITQKNVSQSGALFDLLLRGYDSLSKSISTNMDMIRLLQEKPENPAIDFINERSITNMIGAIYYSREDIIAIHVISAGGKVFNYGNVMNVIDPDYAKSAWFAKIKEAAGKMAWIGVSERSIIDKAETQPVFAFGRLIYDLNEHTPIGIVLIEVEPQPILDAMDNLKLGKNSEIYLQSDQGNILASSVKGAKEIPEPMRSLPAPRSEQDIVTRDLNRQLMIVSKLPFGGWTIWSRTPDTDLDVELDQTKRFLFFAVAALIVVSALIASLVSRTISSPLKRMIREMKKVESGNFAGQLNVSSYREINQLAASFNRMVQRISELIERVKISSVSEKNAELHALQSQVNPHFLYNTLDMIYWMLDEKGEDRLGEVVLSLSRMFRYSSHWEAGMEVTLREELEQIGYYLTIILNRLDGRLTVDIDIDERWMAFRLPKMTLQPIIENAVKHGLEPLDRPGTLNVFAEARERYWTLTIQDNGMGMSAAERNDLIESMQGRRPGGKTRGGIGMQNLQSRLQYMYGEAYGLRVESEPGRGTTVVLTFPLPKEGDAPE
ncbi:cache domain-containing sensor histidine kinase [Cohnella thermotolerans]|uniref:histidine kinase n=1 Tax=Cohnella thermotolerans TaxID=329858 RepID=UPI00040E0AF0